jgi:hypothetical protein
MSIQEILAAQQRAAKATRKNIPAPYRKPAPKADDGNVGDLLAAQQRAANATRKPAAQAVRDGAVRNSVAEIIERQRKVAAEQKAASSGMNQALSASQKAIVDSIRTRYQEFLAQLDKELSGQELKMTPPATEPEVTAEPAVDVEEPIFTPNIPENSEIKVVVPAEGSDINGISVGDEMGGQVAVTARPKRNRRKKAHDGQSAKQE